MMQNDKPLVDLAGEMHILEPGPWDFDHYRGDGPYDSFVEREVRKRIEARGWWWSITSSDSGVPGPGYSSYVGDEDNINECAIAPTPAAALLTAYIAALEALNQ